MRRTQRKLPLRTLNTLSWMKRPTRLNSEAKLLPNCISVRSLWLWSSTSGASRQSPSWTTQSVGVAWWPMISPSCCRKVKNKLSIPVCSLLTPSLASLSTSWRMTVFLCSLSWSKVFQLLELSLTSSCSTLSQRLHWKFYTWFAKYSIPQISLCLHLSSLTITPRPSPLGWTFSFSWWNLMSIPNFAPSLKTWNRSRSVTRASSGKSREWLPKSHTVCSASMATLPMWKMSLKISRNGSKRHSQSNFWTSTFSWCSLAKQTL